MFAAADQALARGEGPAVERVRVVLGRGGPAAVGPMVGSAGCPGLPAGD
ncbi:DNA-binding protein [Stenotrophomonas acidaminiphila]